MRRREFIALLGIMIWSTGVVAQQRTGKVRRIGYLSLGTANPGLASTPLGAFRQGLRDSGWVEGQNIIIEYRYAEGQYERLPGLADELVRLKVDLIVASPTPPALAAKKATETIPIVGISFDNPVEHGLVASLARPGGNVTGLSYGVGPDIFGKDLELLRELIPEVRLVAVLSNPVGPNHASMMSNVKTAATSLGLGLLFLEARGPEEFDNAFAAMVKEHAGALFVYGDPMFLCTEHGLLTLLYRIDYPRCTRTGYMSKLVA
jgi:putative ABC transport system substrate-binding protein